MHSRLELVDPETLVVDLVTLAALKLELGITTTSEDDALAGRITRYSKAIAEYCERVLAFCEGIETFTFGSYEARETVSLSLYPVDEIASIAVNGSEIAADTYNIDRDNGLIWLADKSWWCGTIVVNYSGGYVLPVAAPGGLQEACLEAVRWRRAWSAGRDPTVRDVNHGDLRVSYFAEPVNSGVLPPSVLALVGDYRRRIAG